MLVFRAKGFHSTSIAELSEAMNLTAGSISELQVLDDSLTVLVHQAAIRNKSPPDGDTVVLLAGSPQSWYAWRQLMALLAPTYPIIAPDLPEEHMAEYLRVLNSSGGLRAGLAYYRSAALSAAQNKALQSEGQLSMPILAISADQGSIVDMAAPLRPYAKEVYGVAVPYCGHFLPEEQPQAIARELSAFFVA